MRVVKGIGWGLLGLLGVGIGLVVWAGSGTLSEDELAVLKTYPAPPAAPRDTLTVVTYNLGYLSGMTNNRPVERSAALFADNMDAAVALLRRADADLIAFQEIDLGAARSFDVQQLDSLARRLGYPFAAMAVNWDERYVPFPSPDPRWHFGRVLSGQAVLSRYPIRRHERITLARPDTVLSFSPPLSVLADGFYLDRLAQVVEVDAGRPVVLVNVHLEAFQRTTRERQAMQVRALYDRYRDAYPVVVLGDFNALRPADKHAADAPPERRASMLADRTLETLLPGSGLREVFPDSTLAFTFPADTPRVKIDHIFVETAEFDVLDAFVLRGPNQPSDHRAIAARLVVKEGLSSSNSLMSSEENTISRQSFLRVLMRSMPKSAFGAYGCFFYRPPFEKKPPWSGGTATTLITRSRDRRRQRGRSRRNRIFRREP